MYISPIDILDISLEELENIDQKSIIRLEKRLKVLRLQNQDEFYNLEEMHLLLEQLKDAEKRKVIVFIEKHPNFKSFISSGENASPSTFNFQEEFKEHFSEYSDFLAPYLNTFFFPLLKREYQIRKYDTTIAALQNEHLFSNDLLLRCYKYLEQQTLILTETIKVTKPKTLYEKCPQVTYDTHVTLLNLLPNGINSNLKLNYVNALVDYYNKTKINNSEYNKLKKAYRLFAKIKTGDSFVDEQFVELASLGFQTNGYEKNESDDPSLSRIAGVILFFIVIIIKVAINNNSSDYTIDTNKFYESKEVRESFDKVLISTQRNFIWNLYEKAKDSSLVSSQKKLIPVTIKTGDQVYPGNFDRYFEMSQKYMKKSSSKNDLKSADSIMLKNGSKKSLVLFLKSENDPLFKSVFINKNDSLKIKYIPYTKLIYYLGSDFSEMVKGYGNRKYFKSVTLADSETLLKVNEIYGKKDNSSHISITNDEILYRDLEVSTYTNPDYLYKRKYKVSTNENGEDVISEKNISYNNFKRGYGRWNKSKTLFFEEITPKNINKKTKKLAGNFTTGQNLYPEYFRNYSHVDLSGYPVLIKNQSDKHLVVFNRNLSSRRDFTFYIKPREELEVFLFDIGDSLYFYRGKHFYNYQDKPVLKQDLSDVRLFNKPAIIKAIREENPYIKVKEKTTEISGLRY